VVGKRVATACLLGRPLGKQGEEGDYWATACVLVLPLSKLFKCYCFNNMQMDSL